MQSSAISALRLAVIIAIMLFLIVVIVRLDCIEEKPSAGVSGARTSLTGEGREATVERSVREFSHDFIVTKGEKVVFDNHARIVFSYHADLVVKGSLSVIGTEQDPVVLQMGKGMIRLEEGASLTLEHCTLTGEDSDELSLFHSRDASFSLENVTVNNTKRKIIYSVESNNGVLKQVLSSPRCFGIKANTYIYADKSKSLVSVCNLDTKDNNGRNYDDMNYDLSILGNIRLCDSIICCTDGGVPYVAIKEAYNSCINKADINVNFAKHCTFIACQPYAHSYDYRYLPIDFAIESCIMHDLRICWDRMRPDLDLICHPYTKCRLHYNIEEDVDAVLKEEAALDEANYFDKYMVYGGLKWFAHFCSLNLKGNEIYITIRKDQEKRVREEMAKHKLDIQEDGKYYRVIQLVNNE